MSKIIPPSRFGSDFGRVLDEDRIRKSVNNISFGVVGAPSNVQGFMAQGTTPAGAGTEFSISHNLGYIPLGYLMFSIDQDARIYKGTTAWTKTTASFKCSGISANYVLFIH